MGLFSLDERIFPALKSAFQDGDYSLTGGVKRLIAKSSLHAMLTRDTWFDIDTNDDYRHALQHLKSKNVTREKRDTRF